MKLFIYFTFFLICLGYFFSCKETPAIQVENDKIGSLSIMAPSIKEIGDVIYDHPLLFLQSADSFILLIDSLTPQSEEEELSYLLLLLNAGYTLRQDAQILKSISVYERALELYFTSTNNEIDFVEYLVKPLGSLYTITGDLDKAISIQFMAIDSDIYDKEKLASIYGNLAITLKQLELWDSVISVSKKGLSYSKDSSIASARLYNEIAQSYFNLGYFDSARHYTFKSISIFEKSKDIEDVIIWYASALSMKSRLNILDHKTQTAETDISQAINLVEKIHSNTHNREKAKFYLHRAKLYFSKGQILKAKDDFEKSIRLIKKPEQIHYPDNTITDAYFGIGKCYDELNYYDSAIEYFKLTIENDYIVQQFIATKESNYYNSYTGRMYLKTVMDALWEYYQSSIDRDKLSIVYDMLWVTELSKNRQLINEINRSKNWNTTDSLVQSISKAQNQLRFLYEELALVSDVQSKQRLKKEIRDIVFKTQLSDKIFEKKYQTPDYDSFREKIKKLSTDADIISWQMNDRGNSYVITVSKNDLAQVWLLNDSIGIQSTISHFVHKYFISGPDGFLNNPREYFNTSEQILNQIIPNHSDLKALKWITSLDGIIYGLPLEALCVQKKYLIEYKDIIPLYSFLNYENQIIDSVSDVSVNIFALDQHKSGFGDLLYVKDEVENIRSIAKVKVYWNDSATFENLTQSLNSGKIVHISTHAVLDTADQPYLVFKEKINLEKIQFTITQSPLVILSACETAIGKRLSGEGLESLNKAFLSKGVKGVIAAQWPVDDAIVPDFIKNFYQELKITQIPDQSLRNVKRAHLQKSSSLQNINPWHWAVFTYTGEHIVIDLKTNDLLWFKWTGLAIGLVLIGSVLYYRYFRKTNNP